MKAEANANVCSNLEPVKFTPKQLERFWSKVKKVDGDDCWEWQANCHTTKLPYGQCKINGVGKPAHRHSFEIHFGKIPDGLWVCHKCDNPKCVRPDHLFLGTAKENSKDRDAKGRGICGEKSPNAKLNLVKVAEIRSMMPLPYGWQTKLARIYNVSPSLIRAVVTQLAWKNTPMDAS